ncbi:MAG: hypothetical protein LBI40_01245, partial [Treponema sp.]|nr:hypothetical protein [Treponema sp.]
CVFRRRNLVGTITKNARTTSIHSSLLIRSPCGRDASVLRGQTHRRLPSMAVPDVHVHAVAVSQTSHPACFAPCQTLYLLDTVSKD